MRGAFAGVVLLLVLELACRLFIPVPADLPRESVGGTTHLRPHVTFTVAGEDFRNTVVTNSQGFHDREHPPRKAAGTRRIVVLGDSMVEAVQVPREQNLCALLEKDLGEGAEVLNMGIAGAGQAQEYLVLQDQAARSAPDVVVLCLYASNDVFNNSPRLETKKGKPFFVERDGRLVLESGAMERVGNPLLDNPLWRWSNLYRVIVRKAILLEASASLVGAAKPDLVFAASPSPDWQEAWSVTRALLREIGAQTEAQGARLLVVLLPGKLQVLPAELPAGRDVEAPHRRLAEFCRELRLDYVDLTPEFRAAARSGTKLYFQHDEHLTPEGHALAARLVAGKLRSLQP